MRAVALARLHKRRRLLAALAAGVALGGRRVEALDPRVPITLIVPAAAGVSTDRLGRIVAEALSKILEAPVRVENVPGDGGVTGTNAIAVAATDGSVLGVAVSSAIIGGKLLSRGAKFSPIDDFQWLAILGTFPNALVVGANSRHPNLASWLAASREAQTPLAYASIGTGSAGHLAGAYLRVEQGARLVHRSVESADERYALLAEGKIDALFDGVPSAAVQAPQAGGRIVAVTSGERIAELPSVPSFGELWGQSFLVWIGVVAPKGLDSAAYVRLATAIGVLLAEPRYAESLRAAGLTFTGLAGRRAISFLEAEFLHYAKLIAFLNEEGQRP
jgi:tripartite-type tricarboxylate transporter receptor subunit TctC